MEKGEGSAPAATAASLASYAYLALRCFARKATTAGESHGGLAPRSSTSHRRSALCAPRAASARRSCDMGSPAGSGSRIDSSPLAFATPPTPPTPAVRPTTFHASSSCSAAAACGRCTRCRGVGSAPLGEHAVCASEVVSSPRIEAARPSAFASSPAAVDDDGSASKAPAGSTQRAWDASSRRELPWAPIVVALVAAHPPSSGNRSSASSGMARSSKPSGSSEAEAATEGMRAAPCGSCRSAWPPSGHLTY